MTSVVQSIRMPAEYKRDKQVKKYVERVAIAGSTFVEVVFEKEISSANLYFLLVKQAKRHLILKREA